MSATSEPTGLCGKWMPRARAACARQPGHPAPCASPEAMERQRQRTAARKAAQPPTAGDRARWNRAYKFVRLGISEDKFLQMLADQGYACALCHLPFEEGQRICADHDHACCPMQPRATAKTCGKCLRGLLHVQCNRHVGVVELYGEQVRAYLARVDRAGLEPAAYAV